MNQRQLSERQFYDKLAQKIDVNSIGYDELCSEAASENRYIRSTLGDIKGKKILDLGCGSGEDSSFMASAYAKVLAIDVSMKMAKLTKTLAEKFGVGKNLLVSQMLCERLAFPDGVFDFVFGRSVLHHVDIIENAKEVARVLKPGGKAIFVEPLEYNPLINLYRKIVGELRTEHETPIAFKDIQRLKGVFEKVEHREFHLTSLIVFGIHFLQLKLTQPEIYEHWMEEVKRGKKYRFLYRVLQQLDQSLLTILPPLRPLCWETVLVCTKGT